MRSVEIPDSIYEEAASRAAAQGQSVDELVLDMLKSLVAEEEDYAPLTPEQLEKIAEAGADIEAGRVYTPEQVREHFARRKAARIERAA